MESLWNENYTVTQIVLACLVKRGEGSSVHKNRPSFGLAINCDGEKQIRKRRNVVGEKERNDLFPTRLELCDHGCGA